MALTNCKECGKEVSKKAETCPHCGFSFKKQQTRRGCGAFIFVWALAGIVAFIFISTLVQNEDPSPGSEQIGYFKGSNNNRIYIIYMDQSHDAQTVRSYANGLKHTQGRNTHAFFYSDRVKWADQVTLVNSYDHAYEIIDNRRHAGEKWQFFYSTGIGGETFADCRDNYEAPLCVPSRR